MTTTDLGPSWSERLNPRNWTLAWKLIAIGLVPALLALTLGVLRIADQADDAAALGVGNRLIEIRGQVSAATEALRQERDEAALFVAAGRSEERGVLDIGIGQTDAAVTEALISARSDVDLDDTTTAALVQAEEALAQLGPLRTDVSAGAGTDADAVVQRYTGVITRVDGLDRALLRQLRTPDVAGAADALTAAISAGEQLAIQHTVLGAAIRAGQLRPSDVAASVAADNRFAAELSTYQIALTPEQLERFGVFGGSESNGDFTRIKDIILTTDTDRPVIVDPAEWDAAFATALAAVQESAGLIRNDIVATSAAAEETASNQAGINSVLLLLGLLLGITIAVLVARALIRSLRVLRTSALDVAERRLPHAVESMRAGEAPDVTVDPVPLDTRDEVGQVARAFDAVHGQAIRLAADQAALQTNVSSMFVNLSRRSQALVERQLQLIEQLESNEQDPDQLSNLFQLDHLATRMRRNSENLLVLAGTDLAKRNIAPVPMVDVLRAAVSEVEQYQRIVVQAPPTTAIVGRAASDLVHLLAELLDNATNFSPPDSQVVMSTTRTNDGDILVEIADRGVGMIDYELADANQRLGGPSSVDVSASRRMGLFVVGRLGTRHGVGVQLSTSSTGGPGTGLTASVTVPARLVPTTDGEPARPARVGAAAATGSEFDVPPQRGAGNGGANNGGTGNGVARNGSLSALVAGTDGPTSLPPAFDAGRDSPSPGADGTGTPPLPTRRPGSSLNPDGPGGSDVFGRPDDPNPATPSVADQARQDQLAAAARESGPETDDTAAHSIVPPDDEPTATPTGTSSEDGQADKHRTEEPDTKEHSANGSSPPAEADQQVAKEQAGDDRPDGDDAVPSSPDGTRPDARHTPWPNGAPPHSPTNGVRPAPRPAPRGAEPRSRPGPGEPTGPETRPEPLPRREPRPRHESRPRTASERQREAQPDPAPPPRHVLADQNVADQNVSDQGGEVRPPSEPSAPPTAPIPTVSRSATVPPDNDPVQAARSADEKPAAGLFASDPSPTSEAEPPQGHAAQAEAPAPAPAPAETTAPRPETWASGFEMGETTPIFEEIASAWFRSNRPLPVEYQEGDPTPQGARPSTPALSPASGRTAQPRLTEPRPAEPRPAEPRPAEPRPAEPRPAGPLAAGPLPVGLRPAGSPPAGSTSSEPQPNGPPAAAPPPSPAAPAPIAPLPTATREPAPQRAAPQASVAQARAVPEPSGFASPADEGWRAADNAVPTERPDELTSAGLPKRRPRARLVPGSAGSAVLAPPVSPARSAESVRGRLASYQQGVRQGRESRYRREADAHEAGGNPDPAGAGRNHDEEST